MPNSYANAHLKIYSKDGTVICRLTFKEGGCVWNLKDLAGKRVPSGIYFYTINVENKEKIGKIVISK
jgi:hypothetical protein